MHENPSRMTKEERLQEVAEIMAAAIVRLKNRKLRKTTQIPLDFPPKQRVHDAQGDENP